MPYCAHCGNELSPSAPTCPRCGHPTTAVAEVAVSFGAPGLRLAGFWIRFAGYLIDGIIISIVNGMILRAAHVGGALSSRCGGFTVLCSGQRFGGLYIDGGVLLKRQLIAGAVFVVYTTLMLALNDGRTVGALATGIRVARPDGSRISFGRALGRQLFSRISRAVLFLGFLWAAWDRDKRTWHDAVADTRVFSAR